MPSADQRTASPATTAAELVDFSKAIQAPAFGLVAKDWKNDFADAVKRSFGADKTSLDEARKVRDRLLAELQSSMATVRTTPTPYVPEAWAVRQAVVSFLGTMRDISSTHMDEILAIAADDSLGAEEKMDRCSKIHLRQDTLMNSAQEVLQEAGAAWEKYASGKVQAP